MNRILSEIIKERQNPGKPVEKFEFLLDVKFAILQFDLIPDLFRPI